MIKKVLLLFIAFSMIISCVTSQEIIINFPEDANWKFEYYDSVNNYIGDGKLSVVYNEDDNSFKMTITESAFGDTAIIEGTIIPTDEEDIERYLFIGSGTWFLGEDFEFRGDFNKEFTKIYIGSIGYSKEIEENIADIITDFYEYRKALIIYELSENKEDLTYPEIPTYEDYIDKIYIWKAELEAN